MNSKRLVELKKGIKRALELLQPTAKETVKKSVTELLNEIFRECLAKLLKNPATTPGDVEKIAGLFRGIIDRLQEEERVHAVAMGNAIEILSIALGEENDGTVGGEDDR